MNPKVIRQEAGSIEREGGLLAVVVRAADGTRSVSELAVFASRELASEVDEEMVFLSLDCLADAGLLEKRIAPPAAVSRLSRRQVIHQLGLVSVAAGIAGALFPRRALGEGAGESASEEKEKKGHRPEAEARGEEHDKKVRASPSHQEEHDKKGHSKASSHQEQHDKKSRSKSVGQKEERAKQGHAPNAQEGHQKKSANSSSEEQQFKRRAQDEAVKSKAQEERQK